MVVGGGEVMVFLFWLLYCARLYLSLNDLANSLKYFNICDRNSSSDMFGVGEKLSPLCSREISSGDSSYIL